MAVVKTRYQQLTPVQRREIDDAVASAKGLRFGNDRFVSDEGDTMAWFLLLGLAAVGGAIAIGVESGLATGFRIYFLHPSWLLSAWRDVNLMAFLACDAVAVFCAVHFLRVHGRHGWLLTSWGVVKLRGSRVHHVAFSDIVKTDRVRHKNKGGRFSSLEMTLQNGTTWTTCATQLMDTIQSRVGA